MNGNNNDGSNEDFWDYFNQFDKEGSANKDDVNETFDNDKGGGNNEDNKPIANNLEERKLQGYKIK